MEKDWEEARRRKRLEQRVLRLEQELETPVATAIAEAGGFETLAVGPVAEGEVLVREGKRVAGTPWAHESRHRSGSPDALQGALDANARVEIQSSGTTVGTRRALNLVPGTGVAISAVDNPDRERVDVTLTATGGGGGGGGGPHAQTHESGGTDPIVGPLDANARVGVQTDGISAGTRRTLNLVAGPGMVVSATDNPGQERVDVTLESRTQPHAATHLSGGTDPIVGLVDANARVRVQTAGIPAGTRRAFNLVAGPGMVVSAADNPAQERVDVTLESTTRPHAATHESGGTDPIVGPMDANARVGVQAEGVSVGTRRTLNLLAGPGMAISATDNPAQERVDVTLTATGGGGGGGPHAETHRSGGTDPIAGLIDANARVQVRRQGVVVGTRRAFNLLPEAGVAIVAVDNPGQESVDIAVRNTAMYHPFTIRDPRAGDDTVLFRAVGRQNVTGVYAVIAGGTSVTWQLVYGPDRSAAGTPLFPTPQITDSSTTGTVHNGPYWITIVDSWLRLQILAVNGPVTEFHLTISYSVR